MDKTTIDTIIQYLHNSLVDNGLKVNALALFGSALSGQTHKDSDIDLVIISNDFENMDIFERAKLTTKAEYDTIKKFNIPLDIVDLTMEEFYNSVYYLNYSAKIVA